MSRTCKECKADRPEDATNFVMSKGRLSGICRKCWNVRANANNAKRRDALNAAERARYRRDREKVLTRQRAAWEARRPEREARKALRIKVRFLSERQHRRELAAPLAPVVRDFRKEITKQIRRLKDADLKRDRRRADPAAARAAMKKWREANPERARELQKNWGLNNIDLRRELDRGYRLRHPERRRESGKRWREQNPEKSRANADKWAKNNPAKAKAAAKARKARRRANGGDHVSYAVILRQLAGQKNRCWWCACKLGAKYHVDHVVALFRGGANKPGNLVIACPTCNLRKGTKTPAEFAGRLL